MVEGAEKGDKMTNFDKLKEEFEYYKNKSVGEVIDLILQRTDCCNFCSFSVKNETDCFGEIQDGICEEGILFWLISEVE